MPLNRITHADVVAWVADMAGRVGPATSGKALLALSQCVQLVAFLAYTGLRFGEASALRVGSVDLGRGRVIVHRALVEVRGRVTEGTTKTHRSRTVPVPRVLRGQLAGYVAGRMPTSGSSRRPAVGRCGTPTSGTASSTRRSSGRGSPPSRRTTSGTRRPVLRSAPALA